MYVLIATYTVTPGNEGAVETILRELQPLSRAEPGNVHYQVQRSLENPSVFVLYEVWKDEDAYRAHTETDHFTRLVLDGAVPLLESRERAFYESVE